MPSVAIWFAARSGTGSGSANTGETRTKTNPQIIFRISKPSRNGFAAQEEIVWYGETLSSRVQRDRSRLGSRSPYQEESGRKGPSHIIRAPAPLVAGARRNVR